MNNKHLRETIRHLREDVLPWCPAGYFRAIIWTIWELEKQDHA